MNKINKKIHLSVFLFLGLQTLCSYTNNHKKIASTQTPKDTLYTFFIYGEKVPVGYLDQDSSITYHYGFKLDKKLVAK